MVHGIFTDIDKLRQRLIHDIYLYRQTKLRSFPFVTYQSVDMDRLILPELEKHQRRFLSIYFLSHVFSEIPKSSCVSVSTEKHSWNDIKYFSRSVEGPEISLNLPELLNLRRRISELSDSEFVYPQVVYHADVVSSEDLDFLRKSCNQIFMSNTYMLTTKSLLSARTISRNIVGTGLNAILFVIELTKTTKLFDLRENNCLLFPFGSMFRICSIDQAPDGVWYVRLNHTIEQELEVVIEQLQFEVDQSLSWLTMGRFLCAFRFNNDAKEYYKFCLDVLGDDPSHTSSLHYHLGMLYATNKEDIRAYFHMKKALKLAQPTIQQALHRDLPWRDQIPHSSTLDQSMIFGNIADINHRMGKHEIALEFYEKALAASTDQNFRRRFQYKHDILKKMLKPPSPSLRYA